MVVVVVLVEVAVIVVELAVLVVAVTVVDVPVAVVAETEVVVVLTDVVVALTDVVVLDSVVVVVLADVDVALTVVVVVLAVVGVVLVVGVGVVVSVVVAVVVVVVPTHSPLAHLHASPSAHSAQLSPSFTASCWQPPPPPPPSVQVALLQESTKSLQSIGSATVQNENPNRIAHDELPGSWHALVEQSTASHGSCGVEVPVVVGLLEVVGVVVVVAVVEVVEICVVVARSGWLPRAVNLCNVASAMHPLNTDSASLAKKTGGLCAM